MDYTDLPAATPEPDQSFAELKERILADFRQWLDDLGTADLDDLRRQAAAATPSPPGLQALFAELTALRQDVRLQSRAGQAVNQRLDDVGRRLETDLEQTLAQLTQTAADAKALVPAARRDAQRAIVLELAGLVEGLARCRAAIREQPMPRLLWGRRRDALRDRLAHPLDLLLAKGHDALRRLRLTPVAEPGMPFDPECMRAVGTCTRGVVPPGGVAEILRQGYRLGDDLVQTAEVNVESP